jgi:hypothetical protein
MASSTWAWLRRRWRGARAVVRHASVGQLVVLVVFGALGLGATGLLLRSGLNLEHDTGLVVLLLAFIGVVVLGVAAMGWHLNETPATELEFEERPLRMAFEVLSPGLQTVIREARFADDRIRTRARTAWDVDRVMSPWLALIGDLGVRDRAVLEDRGVVLSELRRAADHFDETRYLLDARALLRAVEDRLLGDGAEHPMRRGSA